MKIETVYLAGGINGLSDSDANDWRSEAKHLLPREIAVLDPMARDYRGKEDESVEAIVQGDLTDIKQCQAIIANCPRPSWGTAMELHWSHANRTIQEYRDDIGEYGEWRKGMTVIGYRKTVAIVPEGTPVSPWLRYHTDAIVHTLADAVAQVVAWDQRAKSDEMAELHHPETLLGR